MDAHEHTIKIGTNPDNLHAVVRTEVFGLNKKTTSWYLTYDESVGDKGVLNNIRLNPSRTTYEALVLSWRIRPIFRLMPWLIEKTPNTRHRHPKLRVIEITAAQYEMLCGEREIDTDSGA